MGRHSCKGDGQNWWEFNHHHYHHGWTIIPFAVFLYGLRLRPVGGKHHWCTPNLCFSTLTTHLAPSGFAARELHAFAACRHHTSKPQQMCKWCVCVSRVRRQKCVLYVYISVISICTPITNMYDMQIQSKFIFNIQHLGCIYKFIFNIHIQHYLKKCAYCIFVTPKELDMKILGYLHQYDNITPGSSLKLTLSRTLTTCVFTCFPHIKAPTPKLLLPKDVPWDIPRYRHDLQDLQLHPQGSDVGCFPNELASVAYGRRRPTRNPSTKQRIKYVPDISW